jgi:RimJ/RimL family protein N-acetyltransferase
MTRGILIDADEAVSTWAFSTYNRTPMKIDRAIGIVEDGKLVGAALFSSYNTINAEFHYYGRNTFTRGIVRALAKIALYELRLSRCTVIVPKRPSFLLKKLVKYGFRFEGIQRRYYGPTDSSRFTGCRFVAFKEDLEKLAGISIKKVA